MFLVVYELYWRVLVLRMLILMIIFCIYRCMYECVCFVFFFCILNNVLYYLRENKIKRYFKDVVE